MSVQGINRLAHCTVCRSINFMYYKMQCSRWLHVICLMLGPLKAIAHNQATMSLVTK